MFMLFHSAEATSVGASVRAFRPMAVRWAFTSVSTCDSNEDWIVPHDAGDVQSPTTAPAGLTCAPPTTTINATNPNITKRRRTAAPFLRLLIGRRIGREV